VLTGSTRRDQVERFPYQPTRICDSIADVVELVRRLTPATKSPGKLRTIG
jgi:5'-nucleotidase